MPALWNLGGVLAGNLPFHTQSTLILKILSEPGQGRENDIWRTAAIAVVISKSFGVYHWNTAALHIIAPYPGDWCISLEHVYISAQWKNAKRGLIQFHSGLHHTPVKS